MIDPCSHDKIPLLTVDHALNRIFRFIKPIEGEQKLTLRNSLGRIVEEDIYSAMNIPGYPNASMDGYAIHSGSITNSGSFSLECAGSSWAGRPYQGVLDPGCCIRIFTGAVLPEGADTVVMQEKVERQENQIFFPSGIEPFANVRLPGDDIRSGQCLLGKSKKITAIDLGLLASAGIYELKVKRQLRVAYLSTGDELVALGNRLERGNIYDSNRYILHGLLQDKAFSAVDLGVVRDDKETLTETLVKTGQAYDVIISTGGASVGEADYIKEILDETGKVDFWKIAMKPGKPLAFGKIGNAYFFGLPGNPVSVLATFQQIVLPALKRLCGEIPATPLRFMARCKMELKKSPGRMEFQRGVLTQSKNREFEVESAGKQESHVISAASKANCYMILPAECKGVSIGEWVEVEPFSRFI